MEKKLIIVHNHTSYKERRDYYLYIFIFIVAGFFLLMWFKNNRQNTFLPLVAFIIILGTYIFYRIFRNRYYLADFEGDSKNVRIRYLRGKSEFIENVVYKNIKVELKNTSSRTGFNCELLLRINDKKFIVEDTFDWTLPEMKNLFEFIKKTKNEHLSEKDKFIISRMETKIKNHKAANKEIA